MNKKLFLTGILSALVVVSVSAATIPGRTAADAATESLEVAHYYSFDDTVSDAAGSVDGVLSQNDKSAEAAETGLPQYSTEVRDGASGKSLYFSGSNFLWFQENIFAMDGDFTVSFWMNPAVPAGSGSARIVSTGVWGGNTPGILLGVDNNPGNADTDPYGNLINGVMVRLTGKVYSTGAPHSRIRSTISGAMWWQSIMSRISTIKYSWTEKSCRCSRLRGDTSLRASGAKPRSADSLTSIRTLLRKPSRVISTI